MFNNQWCAALGLSALLLGMAAPEKEVTIHLALVDVHADAIPVALAFHVPQTGAPDKVHPFEATAPGSVSLPAPAGPSWRVEAHAAGYWSAPQTVEKAQASAGLRFDLWRATEILGALEIPRGTAVPAAISLRLQSNDAETNSRLELTTLVCPVDDSRRFRCTAPRLHRADIRFRVPGFASRFFWDVNLAKGDQYDLGKLTLRPGASVVGRLVAAAPADLQDIELELSPARRSHYPGPEGGSEKIRAQPDEQGHFSLESLDPGVYRLVARHPELAEAEVAPIRVVEGSQTEIEAPIVLTPAQPLRITVEPLFDPDQEDWQVRLSRSPSPGQTRSAPAVEASTVAGFLKTDGIALGTYEVEVLDSQGQRMLKTPIAHAENAGIHTLVVDAVRLDGELTLGGEPLLAELLFRQATVKRLVESDLEGRFRTVLPAPGTWDVEVASQIEAVSWHRRDIQVAAKNGVAELKLDLPDTRISASVVDENGEPQAGATVILENLARTRPTVERESDEDGELAFRGLDEDTYNAVASLGQTLSSDAEQIHLRESAESVVQLVLHPNRILEGRIVDPSGNALPGVWLLSAAYTEANQLDTIRDAIGSTDANGAFQLSLRASTAHVALMAFVPGVGTRSALLPPEDAGDIMVGPESGTVQLEFDAPWVFDRSRPLPMLITPQGFQVNLPALHQWARLNGVEVGDPAVATRFTIPLLEPGPYRLCWMTMSDLASRLSEGITCVAGHLGPGALLALRLPSLPEEKAL